MHALVMNEYDGNGRFTTQVTGPADHIYGSARAAIRDGRRVAVWLWQDTYASEGALGMRKIKLNATPLDRIELGFDSL